MSTQKALGYLDSHREDFLRRLFDFLRIPSVSTLPEHQGDINRAAHWLADLLRNAGLDVRIVPTEMHPAVVGRYRTDPAAPTLMLYGHYDVQPAGDESLWLSPPFEPTVRDGAVYARGATDDKGQALANLLALECWLKAAGRLPVNIVVLMEGEEEIGSPSFAGFLKTHADNLVCNDVLVSDSSQFRAGMPAITYSTRGLVYKEIDLTGANRDLHSGVYGGIAPNPANILCQLIAAMKDTSGRVAIPGFYDGVRPLEEWERKALDALPYDEAAVRKMLGVERLEGEMGYKPLERVWARPTLDVNGMTGGFTGPGSATIIPSRAMAKISMRLVPDQNPAAVGAAFDRWCAVQLEGRCLYTIRDKASCAAYLAPVEGPGIQAARAAVKAAWNTDPVLVREGGTLPILPTLKQRLGADSILIGYGLPDCPVHGPNEFFHLDHFLAGVRTAIQFFEEYARLAVKRTGSDR
jgi:acetylornithine deacetylase/succinyl-diaminopimelate desuccinylase-like protein